MQQGAIRKLVIVVALALAATAAFGGESKPQAAQSEAKSAEKSPKAAKSKPKPQPMVDINRASKAELVKLPDVDEALAEKIIAARPYRTKAELVTRKVIPAGTYQGLKRRIVAKPK